MKFSHCFINIVVFPILSSNSIFPAGERNGLDKPQVLWTFD